MIRSLTGHKNEESLKSCAETDMSDHEKLSLILSKKTSTQPLPPIIDHHRFPSLHPSILPPSDSQSSTSDRCPLTPVKLNPLYLPEPQCYFTNYTVYVGNSAKENHDVLHPPAPKRKAYILESSDEED